jgi:ATP-binding cassette subfamily B (MDR/TAP) protein 1
MISSGNLDVRVTKNYHDMLFMNPKEDFRSIVVKAAAYASSQAVPLLVITLGFWYGTTLVLSGEYDLFQFFGPFTVILVGVRSAGATIGRAPSFFKGRQAAVELKKLFDHQSEDDPRVQVRKSIQQIRGRIEFQDVHFSYPSSETAILNGISFAARPGQCVAFLGASKSGKSTIFSLLQRFYEPTAGTIRIDNHDIFNINAKQCRSWLSVVSQEPALFDGTIRDNIALAKVLPDSVIEEVCREVNLHDFIQSFPYVISRAFSDPGC